MEDQRWLALGFGVLLALAVAFVPLAVFGPQRPARENDDADSDEAPATDRLPLAARPMSRTLPLDPPVARSAARAPARAELARTELATTEAPARREPQAEPKPEFREPQAEPKSELTSPIMGYAAQAGWRADASLSPDARAPLASELHALSSEECVVVAVSGTERENAKARVAVELALCVARTEDRRLLLVEADFRHPAIAALLNLHVPEAADFSHELTKRGEGTGNAALGVLLCTPTLHVLPALASRSGDLVLTTHFEACLRMIRDYYDLVIVHAPAASFGVYATAIADVVDAAVVVGEASEVPGAFAKKSPLRVVSA
jgi:Mrp family chromosome partitioning ATPase